MPVPLGRPRAVQEDLVEGGPPDADILGHDPRGVQPPDEFRQAHHARGHGRGEPALPRVHPGRAGHDIRQDGLGGVEAGGLGQHHVDPAAEGILQLVRAAVRGHQPRVDDHDLIGDPVGLLEVLRRQQDRRAVRGQRADGGPDVRPAARVQAGRRLVKEQHRGRHDQARDQVQAPPHAP